MTLQKLTFDNMTIQDKNIFDIIYKISKHEISIHDISLLHFGQRTLVELHAMENVVSNETNEGCTYVH